MAQHGQRWVEVTPSQFPHEAEGLRLVREILPDQAPFPCLVEFRVTRPARAAGPRLVLGRRHLRLVELKYYSGTLRGGRSNLAQGGPPSAGLAT